MDPSAHRDDAPDGGERGQPVDPAVTPPGVPPPVPTLPPHPDRAVAGSGPTGPAGVPHAEAGGGQYPGTGAQSTTGPTGQPADARKGGPPGGRNILGLLSLVFGLVATGCCCCPWFTGAPLLGGVPALVLGLLQLRRVRTGEATNRAFAIVGIVLALIALSWVAFDLTSTVPEEFRQDYVPN